MKIGIYIAGVDGAIGSTLRAGLMLIQNGRKHKQGMFCDNYRIHNHTIVELLSAPRIDDITVGGWDLKDRNFHDVLVQNNVLSYQDIEEVNKIECGVPKGNIFKCCPLSGSIVSRIEDDIEYFKAANNVDKAIVVDCLPTGFMSDADSLDLDIITDIDMLEAKCNLLYEAKSPSMAYSLAAARTGSCHINFSPNKAYTNSLLDYYSSQGSSVAGSDGKTGQTLLKSCIAPMMMLRDLRIDGWYSLNLLGNNDGKNLENDDVRMVKIDSKLKSLDSLLDYEVADHVVDIKYYSPRSDSKEAWDNIDFSGFLGYPMQLKINLLGRDSILASPLILDVARLLCIANREGCYGYQPQFSMFFKKIEQLDSNSTYDLFQQRQNLIDWVSEIAPAIKDGVGS